jgi:hypothetical protein
MKKLVLFLLMGVFGAISAGNQSLMVDVVNAFRKKDAGTMAIHFDSNLEIDIPGNKGMYSSGQAKVIMQQYLDNNSPSDVKLSHSGNSANGSKFAIIDFSTSSGSKKAKVYFNTSEKISEIKVE